MKRCPKCEKVFSDIMDDCPECNIPLSGYYSSLPDDSSALIDGKFQSDKDCSSNNQVIHNQFVQSGEEVSSSSNSTVVKDKKRKTFIVVLIILGVCLLAVAVFFAVNKNSDFGHSTGTTDSSNSVESEESKIDQEELNDTNNSTGDASEKSNNIDSTGTTDNSKSVESEDLQEIDRSFRDATEMIENLDLGD